MIELLPPLQRWLLFAGVLLLVGIPAWRSFVLPRLWRAFEPEAGTAVAALERRMARAGLLFSLALIPVWILRLQVQLMGFRDPFVPLAEDLRFLVLETFWGDVWIAQGVFLIVLAGIFASLDEGVRRRASNSGTARTAGSGRSRLTPRWLAVWSGVILLVLTLSLSSHAMSVSTNRVLAVAVDALHTVAAGAWIGTLALILALLPSGSLGRTFLSVQLRSFSPLAVLAVGVLVSMGAYLAVTHLAAVRDLWASSYGRVLTAKIGFAGVVLALGFLNWRRGLPALESEAGARIVFRRAAFEVGTVAVVLLMTAILVGRSLVRGG